MMHESVSVVIAYRDMGCEFRRAAFRYVHAFMESLFPEVVVESGESDATFTRASAINAAIRRATGDVIVQADPDSLVRLPQIVSAVTWARSTGHLVIPHDQYLYTGQHTAAAILAGDMLPFDVTPEHCESAGENGSGNVVVFTQQLWEDVGGFDERFGLWGGDDAAFRYAAEAFCGPMERLAGPMVHLWHPRLPQSFPGGPGYAEQFAILAEYRNAAAVGAEAVRNLVRSRP